MGKCPGRGTGSSGGKGSQELTVDGSLQIWVPVQGQDGGDAVRQARAARLRLPVLEKAQVPPEAGRFSQVYPSGPLFLPGAHSLRTEPHVLPENELKELTARDRDIKALPPEERGLPVHWRPLRPEGSKGWVEPLLLLFQGAGQSGPNLSEHQLEAGVPALQVDSLTAGVGDPPL